MLFLDTEFDAYRGPLISLALISDIDGHEFYGVLQPPPRCAWRGTDLGAQRRIR